MKKLVYSFKPYIKLFKISKNINGKYYKNYHQINLCDGTMVILKKKNKILMLKEFRFAFKKKAYGLPGGIIENKKIKPINVIKRELLEETGLEGKNWKFLLKFKRHGNYDCGTDYLFSADFYRKKNQKLDIDKNNEMKWINIKNILDFINTQDLTHGVISSLLYYKNYQD